MERMNISEVLYGAADHIDGFGHRKFGLHGDGDPETAPACALGAIIVAAGLAGNDRAPGKPEVWRAAALLRVHCGLTDSIADWNNAPDRTAEQVIETLRAAAIIEAAKETATFTVTPADDAASLVTA